ncbi:SnoaL-like domain-containing protein [Ulvibacterium marinum]|uniref:SnoaL-like domain-containing protein n=1 Tax=Ulvibacterium marinum TaxID=2419782 RepID=UPI002493F63E|nr:SnoaL-like domain-containing protein [Ulvibacterium marinum]
MTTQQIADRLVNLLRAKKFIEAQTELYHKDIWSREPQNHPFPLLKGKARLIEKERQFLKAIRTWHEFKVSEPLVSRDYFSIRMYTHVDLSTDRTIEIDEIIVYGVDNDKIISERFFYKTNE